MTPQQARFHTYLSFIYSYVQYRGSLSRSQAQEGILYRRSYRCFTKLTVTHKVVTRDQNTSHNVKVLAASSTMAKERLPVIASLPRAGVLRR